MTTEQIKTQTQYGDYTTLGQVLGITAAAAKMRFLRGDEAAKAAMVKIIDNRKCLIEEFKKA